MLPWILNYWPWLLGLFFVAIIIAICLSTITIDCYARRRKDDDDIVIKITGFQGLLRYKLKLPMLNLTFKGLFVKREKQMYEAGHQTDTKSSNEWDVDTAIQIYEEWTEALAVVRDLKGWIRKVLSNIQLTEWKWYSYVGTGDAMTAAMTCGLLWSVKSMLFGTLSQFVKVKEKPVVKIEPVYQTAFFATEWSCIVKVKVWHAIVASVYLLFSLASIKRGFRLWKRVTAGTS